MKKNIYLFLFSALIITFFTRNNFKSVSEVMPDVLGAVVQEKIESPDTVNFTKNGYSYELTPLYDYEISAMIVSKFNYKLFNVEKFASVFPYDLCMIWGSNVASGLYKNKTLQFSQDCRWCYARWYGDVNLNWEEFSNSHLLINDPVLEHKVKSLVVGDQVKIKGRLVNVRARLIGEKGGYDSSEYTWNSGVGKSGAGAGACKVIYLEKLDVLKKANVLSSLMFQISLSGLLVLMVWNLFGFFEALRK